MGAACFASLPEDCIAAAECCVLDPPSQANDGAFVEIALCKNFANAAYGPIVLNASMVNPESRCLIRAKMRGILLDFARFPSSKTTVKYNLRFFVNAGTVHFAGGRVRHSVKITCDINGQ